MRLIGAMFTYKNHYSQGMVRLVVAGHGEA